MTITTTHHTPTMLVARLPVDEQHSTTEQTMRTAARIIGQHLTMFPGAHPNTRWTNALAEHTYAAHPAMRLVTNVRRAPELPGTHPHGHYASRPAFEISQPREHFFLDDLGYAAEALGSYRTFLRLRDEGLMHADTRFQVGLPGPESAVRPFVRTAADYELLWTQYLAALKVEITRISALIPAHHLAVQIDCTEETSCCGHEPAVQNYFKDDEFKHLAIDPLARFSEALRTISMAVPPEAWLGVHLCHTGRSHHPATNRTAATTTTMPSLTNLVTMSNTAAHHVAHRLDYIHIPALGRYLDHEEFAPLQHLNIGNATPYLGLICPYENPPRSGHVRQQIAKQYLTHFGVATPCGLDQLSATETVELLTIHHEFITCTF